MITLKMKSCIPECKMVSTLTSCDIDHVPKSTRLSLRFSTMGSDYYTRRRESLGMRLTCLLSPRNVCTTVSKTSSPLEGHSGEGGSLSLSPNCYLLASSSFSWGTKDILSPKCVYVCVYVHLCNIIQANYIFLVEKVLITYFPNHTCSACQHKVPK